MIDRTLRHRVLHTGVRIVVKIMREHRPQLPRVLVGDRHQHFPKRHPAIQLVYPYLLGRGLFDADRLGPLQAAAGTLDQQRVQVRIAAETDFAIVGLIGLIEDDPNLADKKYPGNPAMS